ncbi:MAG: methyltransferase domain-containing protein [Rhodospirillaceae bacterium]|nr:methyltransferase domain-containing protein [Rhodospirillaceae bacterium]
MTSPTPPPQLDDATIRKVIAEIEWLCQMGSLAEARGAAQALADCIPGDPRGPAVLGIVLAKGKHMAAAVDPLGQAVRHFPKSTEVNFYHGLALYNVGRMADAEAAFKAVLAINPREIHALQNLGATLAADGRPAEARAVFEQVLAIDANSELAWLGVADSYRGIADREVRHAALERALAINPDNRQARHMLDATLGRTPDHPDWRYVSEFFDAYADRFETHLVGALNYVGHSVLATMLREAYPAQDRFPRVLDIGCGTGLLGAELVAHYRCRDLVGIDLSQRMLDAARSRGCYTDLKRAEATAALKRDTTTYDLMAAADVLIYIGAVDQLFAACAARLNDGGILAFSVESLDDDEDAPAGFMLRDNTRYGHRRDYLLDQAQTAGFRVVAEREGAIRRHGGRDEMGLYMILEKTTG